MKKGASFSTLEDALNRLLAACKQPTLTLREIVEILSDKARLILIIILSLIFATPLQIPGTSTPFGIVIMILGFRLHHKIWLPGFLLKKQITTEKHEKVISKSLTIVKKMKFLFRPRWKWACTHPFFRLVNAFVIIFFGLLLALPLPIPFSNIVFAWPLVFISLGLLSEDGLFVTISYFLCLVCLTLLTLFGVWIHDFSYFKTAKAACTSCSA